MSGPRVGNDGQQRVPGATGARSSATVCRADQFESDIQSNIGKEAWEKIRGVIQADFAWFGYPFDMGRIDAMKKKIYNFPNGETGVLYQLGFSYGRMDWVSVDIAIGNFSIVPSSEVKAPVFFSGIEVLAEAEGKQMLSDANFQLDGTLKREKRFQYPELLDTERNLLDLFVGRPLFDSKNYCEEGT